MSLPAPKDIVRDFYRAVSNRDASAVAALVENQFHEQCSFTWPDSLPYGGTVSGRSRLRKALAGAASAEIGPTDLELVALTVGELEVAAEVEFSWKSSPEAAAIRSGAVEWWSFDEEGLVRGVRAYYADTAALVAQKIAPR